MKIHVKTPICDQKMKVVFQKYAINGRTCIDLVDAKTKEPWFIATVNLGMEPLGEGCVFLKGWSENEGLPEALEVAGLVKLTGRRVATGGFGAEAQEAKLLCQPK